MGHRIAPRGLHWYKFIQRGKVLRMATAASPIYRQLMERAIRAVGCLPFGGGA